MVEINPHIIIQARMGSTRLPNKVMKPIQGKPMIGYGLERLRKAQMPVTVATSESQNNDPLVDYVEKLGIDIFRGSEDNVLQRYYQAAKANQATDIIRITADNPLVDGEFIREHVEKFKPHTKRYYLSEGQPKKLPLGLGFEMFPFALLEEAYQNAKSKAEREHVTPYMHQNMPGDIDQFTLTTAIDHPNLRLTVDTQDDFTLMNELITTYKANFKNINEIIGIFKENPHLRTINSTVQQKKWND